MKGGDYFPSGLQWKRKYNAMWFDGINNYVGSIPVYPIDPSFFSVSCDFWLPLTSQSKHRGLWSYLQILSASAMYGVSLSVYGSNRLYLWVGGRPTYPYYFPFAGVTIVTHNAWHHASYTYNSGLHVVVLDGVTQITATQLMSGGTLPPLTAGRWAVNSTGFPGCGIIKNVQVDATQIKGNGITAANWVGGTVFASEHCLIHPTGAVIRYANAVPYVVH